MRRSISIGLSAAAIPRDSLALAPFYAVGLEEQWVQVIRTLLIVLLMIWIARLRGRGQVTLQA